MPRFSRRSFLHLSVAASTAATFHIWTEPMLAAAARRRNDPRPPGAVVIDSNENPLGPSQSARDAMAQILPQGGRYSDDLTDELVYAFAQMEGLDPAYVTATVGSTPPLALSVLAFTSPQKSYVTADPGFELGTMAAVANGANVVQVPLTKSYTHDMKAMLTVPEPGVFYICNPNNPTGTLTPRADIEYLVANKPKDSIVVIDEAYIHFTETPSALDLAKTHNDVVVLRTFSKVYGLAGLRCGLIIAYPELKKKVLQRGGFNFMPITGVVAATASLKDSGLVAERRRINATIRNQTLQWLGQNGFTYIPSESNCFMVDVKRPGQEVRDAMAKKNVFVGRTWPIMPTWVRVTVGTQDEMAKFQTAFQKVMGGEEKS
jgi:histidinol-phosphate aminotransferase